MIKSKFSFNIIIPLMLFGLVSFALYFLLKLTFEARLSLESYFYVTLVFLFWFCIVYGGFRTKAISITINYDRIEVRRFFGFGPSQSFHFTDFSGYKTSILASRGGNYEYLYLMQGDKKKIKISAYYHRNYEDLKAMIALSSTDLGFEQFNIFKEVKEIFI